MRRPGMETTQAVPAGRKHRGKGVYAFDIQQERRGTYSREETEKGWDWDPGACVIRTDMKKMGEVREKKDVSAIVFN